MLNIKSLCLGILYFQDATGYEINKLSSEGRFSHFIEASFGSIYPALTKLTEEGLVTWSNEQEEGKPARKVYSITEEGRAFLVNSLNELPKEDIFKSEFLFICLYCHDLEKKHIEYVINARISSLEEKIAKFDEMTECCDHSGSRFAIGYGKALNKAALEYLKSNKHILMTELDQNSVAEYGVKD